MMDWGQCISEAFEDAGIEATKEQIDIVASWAEGYHDNSSIGAGYPTSNSSLEIDRLKAEIAELEESHERQLDGIKKGVARRRKVSPHDVAIDTGGNVTFLDYQRG